MAGAAWLAVVLAGVVAVVLTMFSLRGGAIRHATVVASMPYWNFQHGTATASSLYPVPVAWLSVSNGRWKSPARRAIGGATAAALPAAGRLASGSNHAGTKDEPGTPAQVAEASHVSG
jgi:hypothetical protein